MISQVFLAFQNSSYVGDITVFGIANKPVLSRNNQNANKIKRQSYF
jgi:hypothetical protein